MGVFRVHRIDGFAILSVHHLKNKEMSLKAKGLLSIMLSLSEDWDYSIMGLTALSKDQRDSVMSALEELRKFGYLKMSTERDERGRYETTYDVYEEPFFDEKEVTESDLPNRKNRIGKTESVNPTQYRINNKESIITTTTTISACAHEGIDKLKDWIYSSDLKEWAERKIYEKKGANSLEEYIRDFYENDFAVREKCERAERYEVLGHFQRWLPLYINKQQEQLKQEDNGSKSRENSVRKDTRGWDTDRSYLHTKD